MTCIPIIICQTRNRQRYVWPKLIHLPPDPLCSPGSLHCWSGNECSSEVLRVVQALKDIAKPGLKRREASEGQEKENVRYIDVWTKQDTHYLQNAPYRSRSHSPPRKRLRTMFSRVRSDTQVLPSMQHGGMLSEGGVETIMEEPGVKVMSYDVLRDNNGLSMFSIDVRQSLTCALPQKRVHHLRAPKSQESIQLFTSFSVVLFHSLLQIRKHVLQRS